MRRIIPNGFLAGLAFLVILAGFIDSIVGAEWDHFAVFAIAGVIVAFIGLRAHSARPPMSIRNDLHAWIVEHSNRTGDRPEVTVDRAVAAYRVGIDPQRGHTAAIASLGPRRTAVAGVEGEASGEGRSRGSDPTGGSGSERTGPAAVELTGAGLPNDIAGGKGSSLDKLIGLGARVPATGVITADAYRRFAEAPGIAELLDELRMADLPGPDGMDAAATRIDEAFLTASMPGDLRQAILDLAHAIRAGGRVAVRSSATAEDQEAASFAGQYRSFLELAGDEEILRAVRLTWASLWHPAPRSYRRHQGVDESDIAMAVVVMRMVEAQHAGVVFTVDPGGRADHLRLEYVAGLAEGLVSGAATPTALVLPRSDFEIPPSPFPIEAVIVAALDIEDSFDGPQDIEWAYDGDELYIVQARPITTARDDASDDDGFDVDPMEGCTYTNAGIGEMLPGVLPPLLWTIDGALIEESFRELFDELGVLPELPGGQAIVGRFRGRAALNLDLLKRAADAMPGGTAAEMERQYFGEVVSPDLTEGPERTSLVESIRALPLTYRSLRMRSRLGPEAETVIAAVERVIALEVNPDELDDAHVLAYWRRLWVMAARVVATQVGVAAAAAAAYRTLEMFLETHLGDEAPSHAQRLTAGGIQACGLRTSLDVCDLIQEGLEIEAVRPALEADSIPEMRRLLTATPEGAAFLDRFRLRLGHAGSAAVFAGPTWGEDEGAAWNVLRQAARVELETGRPMGGEPRQDVLDQLIARLQSSRKWKTTRIITGQIVDVRIRLLRRFVSDAIKFLELRERTKVAVLRLGGEARRTLAAAGMRLEEKGELAAPGDVELLSLDELELALAGASLDRGALARRRRIHDAASESGPLPRTFQGRPAAAPLVDLADADVIDGWAASSGRYRGRVRVIKSLGDAHLEPGEVLVANATDPSWTPLFLTAGALIVEEGGPLSHAAIVARELGLPAVLNVPGVVAALSDGDEVTVDGSEGRIVVHRPEVEPRVAPRSAA